MREKKKVKKKKKIDNYIFKRVLAPWLQLKTMKTCTVVRNDSNHVIDKDNNVVRKDQKYMYCVDCKIRCRWYLPRDEELLQVYLTSLVLPPRILQRNRSAIHMNLLVLFPSSYIHSYFLFINIIVYSSNSGMYISCWFAADQVEFNTNDRRKKKKILTKMNTYNTQRSSQLTHQSCPNLSHLSNPNMSISLLNKNHIDHLNIG